MSLHGDNMAVTRATIRTTAWDAVYTYLQTTNAITTSNIYSALNSKLVNTVGYPFVIIHPPSASISKLSATGSMTSSEISMLIEIYHTSSQTVKALADNVTDKLFAGRKTFAGVAIGRLMNMEIDAGDADFWNEGNKRIHRIGFNVSFRYVE